MNKYKPQRLFFDIETQANPENVALMPEPKAPGNLKDPAKIEAAIAEKKAELIESAALDPDYGRILSIGLSYGDFVSVMVTGDKLPVGFHPETDEPMAWDLVDETDLIETFWQHFTDCRGYCVGYNILGFDLPYLLRRSMALGVRVPMLPNLARYRTEPVTDLMAILYNWGADRYKGLKQVARLYGIPNQCPDVDGSKVKDLTPDQLREYQESDIRLTMALYDKMNGVYFSH